MDDLATIRRHYARIVRIAATLPPGEATERVEAAFAAVPRERHAGPGPWRLIPQSPGAAPWTTPDDDPRWLHADALIALDEGAGINNGAPSMWARHLTMLDVPPGARVFQVGAGAGYYTAILAHLAGPGGHVAAHEIEPHLAGRAAEALDGVPNATIAHGNGATDPAPGPHDLVVAFAGVTHPPPAWIDALAERGRMLLPVTGTRGRGAFVLFEREGADRLALATVGRCGFYPCAGARDDALAERWDALLPGAENGARLRMERRPAARSEVALPGGWALAT